MDSCCRSGTRFGLIHSPYRRQPTPRTPRPESRSSEAGMGGLGGHSPVREFLLFQTTVGASKGTSGSGVVVGDLRIDHPRVPGGGGESGGGQHGVVFDLRGAGNVPSLTLRAT